jgi:hypothetical protein
MGSNGLRKPRLEPYDLPSRLNLVGMAARVMAGKLLRSPVAPRQALRFLHETVRMLAFYGQGPKFASHLPVHFLQDIFPGIESELVTVTADLDPRSLPYGERAVIGLIAAHLKPRTMFEIGTYTGTTSKVLLESAPNAKLLTLDLAPSELKLDRSGLPGDPPSGADVVIGERFVGSPLASRVTQLYGDSATFDFAPYEGKIDLVMVDGSHSYDYVISDSINAFGMVAPGGVVIWDDCTKWFPSVVAGLDQLGSSRTITRVVGTRLAVHIAP